MRPRRFLATLNLLGAVLAFTAGAQVPVPPAPTAQEPAPTAPEPAPPTQITVEASTEAATPESASEGTVDGETLRRRPLERPGEVLEVVPGLVVTQHSGAGKANQYFLRGFNLDHGTDLATFVGGVPINMPSHGHGQGYTDLGFLIPELVDEVAWTKGPYHAHNGDFSSAGAVRIDYVDRLERGLARVEAGSFGHARALLADSFALDGGDLLAAFELRHGDGPWDVPEDADTLNGVLRWSWGSDENGGRLTGMGYRAEWTATDQIPARAVASGSLSRFGSLDPSDGGESQRYSLAYDGHALDGDTATLWQAWMLYSDLDLFSNFTYFKDDPVNGDQFEQTDERAALGGEASRTWSGQLGELGLETTLGAQLRFDSIHNGLRRTAARQRLSTVRTDEIRETSLGLFAEQHTRWTQWLRTTAGVRGDAYFFDVHSDDPVNSGHEADGMVSPKLGAVLGPWSDTELFANAGTGFHSNDARGVTLRDDPATPAPNDDTPVDPLVRTEGAEVGVRTRAVPGLASSLALFVLDVDSELLFVGDAGGTEASRASRRVGLEWTNLWQPWSWLAVDAELALTHARFRDAAPEGDHIPGAPDRVLSAGAHTDLGGGLSVDVRVRYFGPRPLTEDGSIRSSSSTIVSARLAYAFDARSELSLDLFNLLDEETSDIEYYYPSRLASEPPGPSAGGYDDVHFHPVVPFAVNVAWTVRF